VSQSAVYYWENGKREPNADTILKLCDVFHISLAELYGVDEDQSDFEFREACEWLEEADYSVIQDDNDQELGLFQICSFDEGTICRLDQVDITNLVNSCIEKANSHRDQLIIDFIKMRIRQQK
jgi:transcriptional regulator with XRE-family HTH domain